MKPTVSYLLLALAAVSSAQTPASSAFGLRDGDTVVFYGDSITDARLYTLWTEAYVVTRFPEKNIRFVHSGWGGDRVSGGGGGPIDLRLDRDVFPYKPTVVTIMLGMNDAAYRPFDQGIADTYEKGYVHIVDSLKQKLPGVRLTLIKPSPYDDVNQAVGFPGGYNAVLLKYSDIVAKIAASSGSSVADMNTPMVDMLTAAKAKDAGNAAHLIPDRVHPGPAGHLVMAEALLKSWNAPATVSATTVDAVKMTVALDKGKVSKISGSKDTSVSWTSTETALPFPIDVNDPLTSLTLASSDFIQALDQQTVTVSGLDPDRRYSLSIDGHDAIVQATGADWAKGLNLATLATPMQMQAREVLGLVRTSSDVHNWKWRAFQVPYANVKEASKEQAKAYKAMDDYDNALFDAARKAAQPKPHTFTITAVS